MVDDLRRAVTDVRIALGRGGFHSPALFQFPRGACGVACDLLAEYLWRHDHGPWRYRWGVAKAPRGSHAWLEQGDVIVDITADQFEEITAPVLITTNPAWHLQFRPGPSKRLASLAERDLDGSMLRADYRRMLDLISQPERLRGGGCSRNPRSL